MPEQNHNEEWRPVVGYEGLYSVSSLARIRRDYRSVRASTNGNIFIGCITSRGYRQARLYVDKKGKSVPVHRLVCAAFNGDPPPGKDQVNHKDGDPLNNLPSNLEWCTAKENSDHSIVILGNTRAGTRHGEAKLTDSEVLTMRTLFDTGLMKPIQIWRIFNHVDSALVHRICRRKSWKHLP